MHIGVTALPQAQDEAGRADRAPPARAKVRNNSFLAVATAICLHEPTLAGVFFIRLTSLHNARANPS
jgi:hypothetical protein